MKALRISKDLPLPNDTVTQKLGWLGTTGSGKTYGASKLAEQFWHIGAQFVTLDPVGVWYGLRLAKDGKKPSGINIPIFGGLHGDVPLEPTSGALLADLTVDKDLSCIIDVSQFESDADKARFAADYANRLFFRKKASPSAMHLFLEEVQEFVPQNPQRGEERMLHAFTRMQKLGRNFGIGSSYITQRPQEVNKKALNMAQTLFVFRTTGTHERAAIEKWIEDKSLDESIAQDLPKILTGHCHVWSPEFLKVSEMVHISEKETFDASATPEVGTKAKKRELTPIDLEKVRTEMAATIEKAKQEDPKLLRAEIERLKKIGSKSVTIADSKPHAPMGVSQWREYGKTNGYYQYFEKQIVNERDKRWQKVVKNWVAVTRQLLKNILTAHTALKSFEPNLPPETPDEGEVMVGDRMNIGVPSTVAVPIAQEKAAKEIFNHNPRNDYDSAQPITGGALRMLRVLVSRYPNRLTRSQLGTLASVKASSGTFRGYLSILRTQGMIEEEGDTLWASDSARNEYGQGLESKSPEETQAMWLAKLSGGVKRMLEVLIVDNAVWYTREGLGNAVGIDSSTGTFRGYLSILRTNGLIEERGDELKASETLFME